MFDGDGIDRRTVLRGTSALASLSVFARQATRVAEAADAPTTAETPEDRRSIEAGFAAFVSKYETLGAVVGLTRFGRFLSGTEYNLHVADQPRTYTLTLGPRGAGTTFSAGENPTADADVSLDADDWRAVLYGDFTGLAPVINGRAYPSRDDANQAVLLLLAIYVAAHLPASADYETEYLANVLAGTFRRGGLPQCEGTPPGLAYAERLQNQPREEIKENILGLNDAPPVTERVAEWVAELSYEDIPDDTVETAKAQITSILGVIYPGSDMGPTGRTFTDAMADLAAGGDATVFGTRPFEASAPDAAMVNSYLAQALEWEDFTYLAHSGSAIVPTALAAAEYADASGEDLITAVVAGNELIARLGEVLTDVVHAGQTLAIHQAELPFVAGKAMGLDADELQAAAGVAAAQPQMTTLPSFSAATKCFTTAQPAHTSVRAAQLAERGLVGRTDILENPLGYCFRVADIEGPLWLERIVAGLDAETPTKTDWRFARQYFNKKFPSNGFHMTAIDAALDVHKQLEEAGIDPSDPTEYESIELRVPLVTAATGTMFSEGDHAYIDDRILDPEEPDWTYIALLYDSVFPVVATLLEGELTEEQYREEFLRDGRARSLYEKTEASPDLSMGIFGAVVEVSTGSAKLRSERGREEYGGDESFDAVAETADGATGPARGEAFEPSPEADYSSFVGCIDNPRPAEKFRTAAGQYLSDGEIERILNAIDTIERYDSIDAFAATVQGGSTRKAGRGN